MTHCIFHRSSSSEIFNLIEREELFIELFNLTCGASSCIFNWCSSEKATKKDRDDMTLLAKCPLQVFMNGSYLLTHESRFQLDMKVHRTSCIEPTRPYCWWASYHQISFFYPMVNKFTKSLLRNWERYIYIYIYILFPIKMTL